MTEASHSKDDSKDQSMEEILQSIKRIIADDELEDSNASAPAVKPKKPLPQESDVLELQDIVEEGTLQPTEPEPAATDEQEADQDVLAMIDQNLTDTGKANPVTLPKPEAEPPQPPASAGSDEDVLAGIDSLLNSDTVNASSSALNALKEQSHQRPPSSKPSAVKPSDSTIEEWVTELLKPQLKDWLNANLPGIVERMVSEEIKKISGE